MDFALWTPRIPHIYRRLRGTQQHSSVCADCKFTMFHPQNIVAFLILVVSIWQAQAGE